MVCAYLLDDNTGTRVDGPPANYTVSNDMSYSGLPRGCSLALDILFLHGLWDLLRNLTYFEDKSHPMTLEEAAGRVLMITSLMKYPMANQIASIKQLTSDGATRLCRTLASNNHRPDFRTMCMLMCSDCTVRYGSYQQRLCRFCPRHVLQRDWMLAEHAFRDPTRSS